jgi:hypothetical protein
MALVRFSGSDVSRYNARTCYHALDISRFPVSLATQLSTSRGVKRTENALFEA